MIDPLHRGIKWTPGVIGESGQELLALQLPIETLRGIHAGEDIWIIGSAASMGHVRPAFFENKVVVGVNFAYRHFPCDWVITKDLSQEHYAELGPYMITSRHRWGCFDLPKHSFQGAQPYYVFDHSHNGDHLDLNIIGTDYVFVSKSTITSAMHIAALMGAANIILCGVDGGTLDGQIQHQSYVSRAADKTAVAEYHRFVASIMDQTRAVRDRLYDVFGCSVYSLNPFIGFDLEGHVYERAHPGEGNVETHPAEEPANAG